MALLPLAAAAAGAGIVAPAPRVLGGDDLHQLGRSAAGGEQLGHDRHRLLDMVEERLVARAEVVLAGLAVGRDGEAVLRAAAVAGPADVAVEAVLRQRVSLVLPEPDAGAAEETRSSIRCVPDVPEQVAGLDEVVAGVEVAVVLERELEPAGLGVDADGALLTDAVRERAVEQLHVDRADVVPHPLLEDVDHEAPVLLGPDRALGDEVARLRVQGPALDAIAPPRVRDREQLGRRALDDRDELDESGAEVVAQEAVHTRAVVAVRGVHRRQHVPIDAVPLEDCRARGRRGRRSACRPCRRGSDRAGPAGRRSRSRRGSRAPLRKAPHSSSSSVPFVWIVLRIRWPGRACCAHELGCAPEEVEPHDGRLAALPGDDHLRRPGVGLEELARRRPRAPPPPSGSDCSGRASPSRGRSSTRSRGCTSPRSASPSGGRRSARRGS